MLSYSKSFTYVYPKVVLLVLDLVNVMGLSRSIRKVSQESRRSLNSYSYSGFIVFVFLFLVSIYVISV